MSEEKKNEVGFYNKPVIYKPIGSNETIELTLNTIRRFVAAPTKSGAEPSERDLVGFLMLCKAQELNPFQRDCWLTGYDTQSGPEFSMIISKAALDKRADTHESYNGLESGLIIIKDDGTIEHREGIVCLTDHGESFYGAWAKVYRSDREKVFYHEVEFSVYDTGRSRWKVDPKGMIVKVAEAGGLRKAFPRNFANTYIAEEMENTVGSVSFTPAETTSSAFPTPEKKALPASQPEAKRPGASTKKTKPKEKPEPKEEQQAELGEGKPSTPPKLTDKQKELIETMEAGDYTEDQILKVAAMFGAPQAKSIADIPDKLVENILKDWDTACETMDAE